MDSQKSLKDFIYNGHKTFLPHVSIDCAIFGYHEHQLKILLIKWKKVDGWCLPGGFILRSETLTQAANRIVKERTSLDGLFLQQFHTFGDPGRSKTKQIDDKKLTEMLGFKMPGNNWLMDHTVSIGYYALTEYSKVYPRPDFFSEECRWWDIDDIPDLLFDHNQMVKQALRAMRLQIYHQPIGYNLLPAKFTLPEIHALYETILDKKSDRRNFSKKLVMLGLIKKLNEQKNIGPHRAPFLYKFDKRKYDRALEEGMVLIF